jgi:uncharacterized membrane protein YczE
MISILPVDTGWDAAVSFGLMVFSIVLLVLLLVVKELALARGKEWRALGQMLNVAIVPLLITFSVTILVRILGSIP